MYWHEACPYHFVGLTRPRRFGIIIHKQGKEDTKTGSIIGKLLMRCPSGAGAVTRGIMSSRNLRQTIIRCRKCEPELRLVILRRRKCKRNQRHIILRGRKSKRNPGLAVTQGRMGRRISERHYTAENGNNSFFMPPWPPPASRPTRLTTTSCRCSTPLR